MKHILNSKSLRLSFLFLLVPVLFYGQTLTGLWVGTVHNDSSTLRKDQSFEIALTEYRGKVYGYSRNEFIVNDTLYYIVKRVKGTIEGDICEVTDEEVVSYNFRGKLDKGIKVTSIFLRNPGDSNWRLDNWKTNAVRKKYYSIGGKMDMQTEKDLSASKLFAHLEELNKAADIAFYKEAKEGPPVVKIAKPERIKTEYADIPEKGPDNKDIALAVRQPELPAPVKLPVPAEPVLVKRQEPGKVPSAEIKSNSTIATNPEPVKETVLKEPQTNKTASDSPVLTVKTEKTNIPVANSQDKPVSKTAAPPPVTASIKNTEPVKSGGAELKPKPPVPVTTIKKNTVALTQTDNQKTEETKNRDNGLAVPAFSNKLAEAAPVAPRKLPATDPAALVVKKPAEDPIKKSSVIAGRKSEFSQEVYFKSDSILLSLYDNGEIDGDTVSVFLNGEVVMPGQGLKSSAIRKTIHMPEGIDSFTLVMFAESLGKYPPNTGLLVIRDGNDVYNLRFSSDFQKSSGIVFRRKQ